MRLITQVVNVSIILILLISTLSFNVMGYDDESSNNANIYDSFKINPEKILSSLSSIQPNAITVSDSSPFYALISTPLAVNYDEAANQRVIPMYIKSFTNPSKAILRAEEQIGIITDLVVGDIFSPKQTSLILASLFWESSNTALIIKQDQEGYNLGVTATPIASYLKIPVIVCNQIDNEVEVVLDKLGVETVYICGDLSTQAYNKVKFNDLEQIIDEIENIISVKFQKTLDYVTLTHGFK